MRDGQTFRLNPLGCVPTNVWSCAGANAAAGHYAAFPDHLIRTIITACSKRGDMVLDPFVGSGTTCVVAASLGRRSFGVDLNPEYASMAKEALGEPSKAARHKARAGNAPTGNFPWATRPAMPFYRRGSIPPPA